FPNKHSVDPGVRESQPRSDATEKPTSIVEKTKGAAHSGQQEFIVLSGSSVRLDLGTFPSPVACTDKIEQISSHNSDDKLTCTDAPDYLACYKEDKSWECFAEQ